MRILVLGNGGRENALYHKIKQSSLVSKVYVTPENGGVDKEDQVNLDILNFEDVILFLKENLIQLVVVGPEIPLAKGIKNILKQRIPEVMIFGPDAFAAQLEASKVFSVEYMLKRNMPTAKTHICTSLSQATEVISKHTLPIVIKADGLAAGKGVSIHKDRASAQTRLEEIFIKKIFGDAGNQVLIQEFMVGIEASLFAICNGKEAVYLPTAQDYKRVFDSDEGPNTGGMGSYCPANNLTPQQIAFVHEKITTPILKDFSYTGLLYIGLMIHSQEESDISIVEFNCRFGDPETQVILPMLETDLVPYLLWASGDDCLIPYIQKRCELFLQDGKFGPESVPYKRVVDYKYIPYKPGMCINVVMASKGYPETYEKNIQFSLPPLKDNISVIHAGSIAVGENTYMSTGGRILSIVGYGHNKESIRNEIYSYINDIQKKNTNFLKFHFRKDIAI